MMMKMMMMDDDELFCGIADRRTEFIALFPDETSQRSSSFPTSKTPWAGFEPAQNPSSSLVEWSCAAAITTTPREFLLSIFSIELIFFTFPSYFFIYQLDLSVVRPVWALYGLWIFCCLPIFPSFFSIFSDAENAGYRE